MGAEQGAAFVAGNGDVADSIAGAPPEHFGHPGLLYLYSSASL